MNTPATIIHQANVLGHDLPIYGTAENPLLYTINFICDSGRTPVEIEADSFSTAIEQAHAIGVDLRFADFSNHSLFDVDFSGCDLTGASFECTSLYFCKFDNCNLTAANFSCSGFWECSLANAKWDCADLFECAFVGTNVSGCNFSLAKNVKYAVFGNFYDAIAPEDHDPITPC